MADDRESRIEHLVEPIVNRHGADLEFVTVRKAGRRSVVVIAVDADGGISLDAIAELSPEISEAMDADDVMGEIPYTLEITSPGVSRPLTAARHWRRAAGRLVRVQGRDGSEILGRIVSSTDDAVTLDVEGTSQALNYGDIEKAVVQVEFGQGGS